ncbi:hypothetical protein [Streptomyces fulvoviolaceus]|uniref:hypothetical protein n=1 Tax=Streptomyces fulvoviolaceus TaxID=285535 RepID=UPI0004C98464|nr:hypothetical protein [Streptomyces fulvoviolaceus]
MAGESPDRSKQRESSAEPTSGSAGAVPEARDPRLAVARESVSRGGVDTATKVFSVRELAAEAEKAESGPVDAGTEGSDTGAPEAASTPPEDASSDSEDSGTPASPTASGDARLRNAVAAWVASADGKAGGGSEEAGESDGGEDSGEGEDSVDAGPEDAEPEDGEPEDTGPEDGEPEDAQPEDAGPEDAQPDDAGPKDAGPKDAGPEDAQPERAQPDDAGPEDAEPNDAGPEDAQPEDSEPEDSEPKDAQPEAEGTQDADAEDAEDAAAHADTATAEPEQADDATETRAEDEGEPEPDADDAPEGDADSDAAAETDGKAETEAETDSAAEVGGAAEADDADDDAEPEAVTPAAADGEDAPEGPPAADDESSTGGAGGNTKAEGEAEAEESGEPEPDADVPDDKPRVDQPTATFKAVRPPRPAVDQPTTTLKLGDAAPKKDPKPEAPAERTSKFIALKPLDEPHTPPTAKPDVTAAVPQIGPERTTQQPLPPKPPLDLLAELTNTPPPPPSPVRTIVRRVKIWTPLALLLAVVFAIVQAVRPLPTPELTLTAEDSYTFDGDQAGLPWPSEGQGWMDVNGIGTMGDFGKQTPVAIGSVAKAMTAYIVLKDHPLKSGAEGEKITVDALAEKEGGYNKDGESTLNTVKEGDVLTEKQAISAIMIPSANNIARLLARWDAGSETEFIKKMNDTAKELGMKNTTYTDASGLKETTVSTAEDQVKLGNELVKIQALMDITSMGQWIDPSGQKWYNYNYLVPYNGAVGIKTGTTTAAGGNLLFAARKEVGGETVTVVGAILGQHKAPIIQTVNDVSKTAMLAARDELTSAKILKKGDVVGYVDDGLGGRTPVVLTKDVTAVGWAGMKVELSFAADDVPHTAKAGTKVGTLTVGDSEGGAVKVPVTLQTDLVEPGFQDKLTRLG